MTLEWSEEQYRDFAREYIKRRLTEGKQDAIEEISAYLADWLRIRDATKIIGTKA